MTYQSPTLRQPTDRAELYAWHADALDALKTGRADNLKDLASHSPELMPPLDEGMPQCGWYAAKVSKRAVLVPSRIWLRSTVGEDGQLVEPEAMFCEIGDRPFDPEEVWVRLAVRPITVGEYRHMMALRAWARESAPDQPQAADGRPIDWLTVQLPPVPPATATEGKKR